MTTRPGHRNLLRRNGSRHRAPGLRRHGDDAGRRGGLQRRRARPVRRRGPRDRLARAPGSARTRHASRAGGRRSGSARHRRCDHWARAGRCAVGGSCCGQSVFGCVGSAVLRRQPSGRAPGRRRVRTRTPARVSWRCWCPVVTPTCCMCVRSASRSSSWVAPWTTPPERPTTKWRGCWAWAIRAAGCSTSWRAPAIATRSRSRAA